MRIRRWEAEEEYDRYMRDRDGEGRAAAQADRIGQFSAQLVAKARGAWEYAAACARPGPALLKGAASGMFFYALGRPHRELRAS
jgi:hypothetical protein